MIGLGKQVNATAQSMRLKAQRTISKGKSLLSIKDPSSSSGESAVVHFTQMSLLNFGDKAEMSDNDLAVVRTVEALSVIKSDVPIQTQEKEARSSGGILFQ